MSFVKTAKLSEEALRSVRGQLSRGIKHDQFMQNHFKNKYGVKASADTRLRNIQRQISLFDDARHSFLSVMPR